VNSLLAFWQLGSAGMLAWGLAAALPILIHLWSRRRYRQETWAAMTFLLAALRKNSRRIQLEQWILLAVRTGILALFALALADPRLSSFTSWVGGSAGGQTHVVLVIDGSYSMDFRRDDKSRFEIAKELARQIVEQGQQGNGYTLVLMSDPPRAIIPQPAFDPADVLEELDNLALPHAGAGLPATLAEIEKILRQAVERQPRLTRRRVCFFTDLQQTTWGEVNSADCRVQLGRLEGLASLELIDLGKPGDANLAVARVEIESATGGLVATRGEIQIQADIQSFDRQDRPRQAVEFLVDGQRIADERVDVPAGGRTTVAATHRFELPGEHIVEVHLADDALGIDNRRWLSVPVREAIRVLAIGGRPGETRHIALALAPQKQSAGPLEITQAPESRLLEGDLTQFDCVILCNVGRFGRDEAGVLYRYVSRGGGLIVFLGEQVQIESYNQSLADDAAQRCLPALLIAAAPTAATSAGYSLAPLDYRHPIVAPFRGFTQSGLLTTPVWKYVKLSPLAGAQTALAFDNGDPAIVESRIGRGRSILVATAASPQSVDRATDPPTPWTALPEWPSFPPLAHEMLRLALVGRSEGRNVLVGDELTGFVPPAALSETVVLSGPNDQQERLPIVLDAGAARWSSSGAITSGEYSARLGDAVQRFAVNVNTRESDLSRFDPELLPGQFSREPLAPGDDEVPPALAASSADSYFRWLLWGVLTLLLIEPLLAWRFGRGRG